MADTTGPEGDEGSSIEQELVSADYTPNVFWARTKTGTSWHVLSGVEGKTLCGKAPRPGESLDDRPTASKTCEACLRISSPK